MPDFVLVNRYRDSLLKLLPPGRAFTRYAYAQIGKSLRGMAVYLARIRESRDDLYAESFPLTATDLLPDWEEFVGLPDNCTYSDNDPGRRALVMNRFVNDIGQGQADIIGIAADLGYTVTINVWPNNITGVTGIGSMPIWDNRWYYVINVNYTPKTSEEDAVLECTLRKHLHTYAYLHFNLTDPYFETFPRN